MEVVDTPFTLGNEDSKDWWDMMGDSSNCSMKSADFQALPLKPLGVLENLEKSVDSQLDLSNQGIPGMLKNMQVNSNPAGEDFFDKGMFNASNSTSRKRRSDFDISKPPTKKSRTEDVNFSDFITSITTVPQEVGDPFLVHDDSSIDGLPRQKLKEMEMQNVVTPEALQIKTTPFSQVNPFESPYSFKPKKTWAQVAGQEDEKKEEEKSVTATSSDSGSSPRSAPAQASFPWNIDGLKAKTPSETTSESEGKSAGSEVPAIKSPEKPKKMNAERKRYRLHQIKLGKESQGYKNYIRVVPRHQRKRYGKQRDIFTPDWTDNSISKRRFDGMLKAWRKALHDYDDIDPDL